SDLALTSQGGIVLGTGSASGDISIRTQPTGSTGARPDVTIDALTAGRDIDLEAGALTLGTLVSGRDTRLAADAGISLASAQAGDDFVANSGASFAADQIRTTGLGQDVSETGYGAGDGSNIRVTAAGPLRLDDGAAIGRIELAATGANGRIDSDALLTAATLTASASGPIALNDVAVVNSLSLTTASSISGRTFSSQGAISLDGGTGASLGQGNAGTDLRITGAGPLSLTSGTAGNDIVVQSRAPSGGGTSPLPSATLGTLSAGRDLLVSAGALGLTSGTAGRDVRLAGSSIQLGQAQAGDDFQASTGGTFSGDRITATGLGPDSEAGYGTLAGSNVVVSAGGALSVADASAPGRITLGSATSTITSTGLLAARSLAAQAAGDLLLADVDVIASLSLGATGGSIRGDAFTSDGSISLNARDGVTLATGDAASTLSIVAGQAIALGTVRSGTNMQLRTSATTNAPTEPADAARTITAGTVQVGSNLLADAAGSISLGTLSAGQSASVQSARSITVTTAQAGTDLSLNAVESIDAGTATAGRDLELITDIGIDTSRVASRSVTVGNARAGDDLVLAAFGAVDAGTLETTGLGQDGTDLGQYPDFPGATVLVIGERGVRLGSVIAAGDVLLNNIAETRGAFSSDASGGVSAETILSGGNINIFNQGSGVLLGTAEAAGNFTSMSGSIGSLLGGFEAT
ncbi:MAG TPA: hypothetical protein VEY69_04780, partial [Lautropia sp.]|nr:hypothetical protein [Lautropia sp.]